MDGQRDKAPPHLPAAASSSPRQAVEHTREVTSRARPAGRRPPSGTAGGVGHPRLATPSAARLPRCGQSQQQGWGPLALPPPVASFIFIIFMRGVGAGPGLPSAPRPRPGIPPRRRHRPQWGAPGFRFGEGVSTWSRLKNVSRPLLRRSSLPQGVSVGSPPCEERSKEARERTAPLPWERSVEMPGDPLLGPSWCLY